VTDHCLRSRNRINVIVAGKHPAPQWLDMASAVAHCRAGAGVWEWASSDRDGDTDVVMASAGDVPTLEALAAIQLLRAQFPDLKIRMVNVVDLMTLAPANTHPHGLSDAAFEHIFTADKPVIFTYHGYPTLIHRLTYRRVNHDNFHVHGFREEGTTTTPFDMVVLNGADRFRLALAVIERVDALAPYRSAARRETARKIAEHHAYINRHGVDLPEILHWAWASPADPGGAT
jgi:xylulose-5-phosphate/fructose-6-phosphate phosphoketolase